MRSGSALGVVAAFAGIGACTPSSAPRSDAIEPARDAGVASRVIDSGADARRDDVPSITTTIPFPPLVATPSPAVAPAIDQVAAVMNDHPALVVEVRGHADGTELEDVGYARANLVASSLAARGISRDRLIVMGAGKTEPRASNATDEGRAKNRRVEFRAATR